MRFGPVPLAQALGAVLAHSVPLSRGRLRKGKMLEAADLTALAQAGLTEVTVARLDPGDMAEDDAALVIARALPALGTGIELRAVGTGRVNLHATGPGLVQVQADAVHALNALDPAITLATLAPLARVTTGEMVATVKIIAYGVAGQAVTQAAQIGAGALALASPRLSRAVLIQTQVDPNADMTKGQTVTAARLDRLGVTLGAPVHVPHAVDPLACAIALAEADLILILTASATSDLHDMAPEALRQAGGAVIHYGMPVDPGNLLFLGQIGARPVIGLPGCAKSPALNGADWVLERVICGLPPTARDLMAMGVGGLLKEIPSRPQPRRSGG
ncbi:MAG: molybdopterin-binding protein [Roseinatronobacter sp.]